MDKFLEGSEPALAPAKNKYVVRTGGKGVWDMGNSGPYLLSLALFIDSRRFLLKRYQAD